MRPRDERLALGLLALAVVGYRRRKKKAKQHDRKRRRRRARTQKKWEQQLGIVTKNPASTPAPANGAIVVSKPSSSAIVL